MKDNGFKWRCDDFGCFVDKKRLRVEELDGYCQHRVRPSDVDVAWEVCGHLLLCEVKTDGHDPDEGQLMLLQRLALQPRTNVFILHLEDGASFKSMVRMTKVMRDGTLVPRPAAFLDFVRVLVDWDVRSRASPVAWPEGHTRRR